MEHTAKVISVETLGDDHLAVKVRCCGDESTDSCLTLTNLGRTEQEIDADIEAHRERVASQHAKRESAKRHVERLIG